MPEKRNALEVFRIWAASVSGHYADKEIYEDDGEVSDFAMMIGSPPLHGDFREFADALATAVARARREALEEAVGRFDDLAAKARERQTTATNMDDLHHAIRAASAAADAAEQVRALISQESGR